MYTPIKVVRSSLHGGHVGGHWHRICKSPVDDANNLPYVQPWLIACQYRGINTWLRISPQRTLGNDESGGYVITSSRQITDCTGNLTHRRCPFVADYREQTSLSNEFFDDQRLLRFSMLLSLSVCCRWHNPVSLAHLTQVLYSLNTRVTWRVSGV